VKRDFWDIPFIHAIIIFAMVAAYLVAVVFARSFP
jgi:hypothetical protein